MKWTLGVAWLLPRASGWLGRIHPPVEDPHGSTLEFMDPDFATAIEVGDQIHVPLWVANTEPNGDMRLSAPMTVKMLDRETGEFRVEPGLLTVAPRWNTWPSDLQRLVLPDASLPQRDAPDVAAALMDIRTILARLAKV